MWISPKKMPYKHLRRPSPFFFLILWVRSKPLELQSPGFPYKPMLGNGRGGGINRVEKNKTCALESGMPKFEPLLGHLLAVWPQASYFTSLNLFTYLRDAWLVGTIHWDPPWRPRPMRRWGDNGRIRLSAKEVGWGSRFQNSRNNPFH